MYPNVGMIKLKIQIIYRAKSCQVNDTIQQTVAIPNQILYLLNTSGSTYKFKVAGIDSHTEPIYSDILTRFVF